MKISFVEGCVDLCNSCSYSVRFESVLPRPNGSLLFCTVGVLLRKLESGLRAISHAIIGEIRMFFLRNKIDQRTIVSLIDERGTNTDFVLVLYFVTRSMLIFN